MCIILTTLDVINLIKIILKPIVYHGYKNWKKKKIKYKMLIIIHPVNIV